MLQFSDLGRLDIARGAGGKVGHIAYTCSYILSEHLELGTVIFHCHSAQKQL